MSYLEKNKSVVIKMDKLSKMLMSLKTEEYITYLDKLKANPLKISNNVKIDNGNIYLEISNQGKRKALVFPTYAYVNDKLLKLKADRDLTFIRYRFLRNRILYRDTDDNEENIAYDNIVKQLKQIDEDIEILETFSKVVNFNKDLEQKSLATAKGDLLKNLKDETNNRVYFDLLKGIKEKDNQLSEYQGYVDFYIEKFPKELNLQKEVDEVVEEAPVVAPKKRGRKPKVKSGGNVNEARIKNIIKFKLLTVGKKN